jgi:glycosyltransferase involved in cell wall biosynthesis
MTASALAAAPTATARAHKTAVLHLLHTMAYGGVETALINWVTRLSKQRFEVHLACFSNPGGGGSEQPFIAAAEKLGLSVHKISWGRRKPLLKATGEVAELIRRYRIDILHTHNCYADCVGALAARRVPVKTISTVYVWSSQLGWKRGLIQAVNRQALRFFDLVTAHCEETFRASLRMGIPADRLKTLICGFDVQPVELTASERQAGRRALGVHPGEIVLANIARLYTEKAQDFLLRALVKIAQQCPQARLWIAGVGPLETELKQLCHSLGLNEKVQFLGFVHDLSRLLALADIHVNPSWTEGVPLAVCSGMAAALPVVATAVGGLPEIIRSGHSGILIPAGSEAALVDAIVSLAGDVELRRRLGAEARRFMQEDYSLATAVRRVEQTYDEVLGQCASVSL